MKIILKPDFYDKFQCTASACPLTCCQEWLIPKDDGSFIELDEEHLCPHLTNDGLCSIVCEKGDAFIPEACQVFPRDIRTAAVQENVPARDGPKLPLDVPARDCPKRDRKSSDQQRIAEEYALSLGCPEVCEILRREGYHALIPDKLPDTSRYDLVRKAISDCATAATGEHYDNRLASARPGCAQRTGSETFSELPPSDEVFLAAKLSERNALFIDICSSYVEEEHYLKQLEDIYTCACEHDGDDEFFASGVVSETFYQLHAQWEHFLKNAFAACVWYDLPDSDDNDALKRHFSWNVIQSACIEHGLLLLALSSRDKADLQKKEEPGSLTAQTTLPESSHHQAEPEHYLPKWADVRDLTAVLCRMMSEDEESLEEYFDECFEAPYCDEEYLRLIK